MSKFQGLPKTPMTLVSYLPSNQYLSNICGSSGSSSCALFPSPPNSPPCLTLHKLHLQTEQLSIVLGTDSNNDHLSSSYMLYTCHALTHSILKSALGGRHYYPHTAGNSETETPRHSGVVNITQARVAELGSKPWLVNTHFATSMHQLL